MTLKIYYKIFFATMLFFVATLAMSANQTIINNDDDNKFYFLALSDIHFDPFVSCTQKPCPLIQKLINNPANEWPPLLKEYDTQSPELGSDSTYLLLLSSLQSAKQVVGKTHAKFVIILGDLLAHRLRVNYKKYAPKYTRAEYREFVYKTLTFLTNQLKNAFPLVPIYILVGNNDAYEGNYVTAENSAFFNDVGKLWSSLLKNSQNQLSMQKQFAYAGYYSVVLPNSLPSKLIMLNSNVFSYKAKGKNVETVAMKEINWLHSQLKLAKENNQKVFIAMHIPEGIDICFTRRLCLWRLISLWKTPYIKLFDKELNEFAPIIAGIFTGHLHGEWMQLLTFKTHTGEIPELGIPSISPVFYRNPRFQLYSYSIHSLQLIDFYTYQYATYGNQAWS